MYDGDEEDAGTPLTEARRALIDAARGATAAIGFEDGPGDPHLAVISRRGDESWTLRTTGTPAHSSQIFQKDVGAGAVYEATRVLSEFYRQLSGERYLTFNPGLALGGTAVRLDSTGVAGSAEGKSNVVAEHMTVVGDLRTISPEQLARAKQTMQAIVAAHLPNTTAELTFDDGYPPMAPTAGQSAPAGDLRSGESRPWPLARDGGRSVEGGRGGCVVRRRHRADEDRWRRSFRPRRPHHERDGGPPHAAGADEARRAAAVSFDDESAGSERSLNVVAVEEAAPAHVESPAQLTRALTV